MDFIINGLIGMPSLLVYVLVALFLLLESTGIPIINTTVLLFAGALAAMGRLNLGLLIFVAVLGSTLGACSAYFLGRRYGEPFLLRFARILHLNERRVLLVERWFQRAGGWMIFFSRMLPHVRPYACFPAGIFKMSFPRFLLAAVTGSILWCVTFLIVGWELGPRWKLALHLVQQYTLPTLGVCLILLLITFFARRVIIRYVKKRLGEDDEVVAPDRDLLEV